MAWTFNPFTDSLDKTGAGASYIDGVVADSSLLPTTVGTPALDSVYLSKAGSGVWLINRKPGGLYVRVANNGVAADWQYLGAFPEVNSAEHWSLYDGAGDPTKELKFDLSGLPTATVRTVGAPAGNGQMLVNTQPVQSNNGTLTASAPVLDLSQTWNNAAVAFTGVNWSFIETAASIGSTVFRISTGAAGTNAIFNIRRDGNATFANAVNVGTIGGSALIAGQGGQWRVAANGSFAWTNGVGNAYGNSDLQLRRDDAGTLAQYNGTNPQTFRLYNTYTSATNFERLNVRWASNELILDAEAGSAGGTLRGIKIGSATSSLLGFYGVTPVDQPATVADPAGGGTQDAEARTAINAIIDRLQELGLIA